jgi:hypothetical protein
MLTNLKKTVIFLLIAILSKQTLAQLTSCSGSPCRNGICVPTSSNSAVCVCSTGYTGVYCDARKYTLTNLKFT